jgi:transposase
VLDNRQQHRGERPGALIEARGAALGFLPGYSPDLTPLEAACAKLKALRRAAAARAHEARAAASWAALRAVTPADARGSFTHCGYPPLAHLV